MIRLFKILMLGILTAAMASCDRYNVQEVLLSREDISLTWKKEPQVVYEPLTWQLGYNAGRNEFRVNDDSMANYFIFRSNVRPDTEGQEVTAYVEWTVRTNIKRYQNLKFEVRKVSPDGRVWLWNKSQKVGVTLYYLE